jgi:hypothetical protein
VKIFRRMKVHPKDNLPEVGIRRDMLGVRPTIVGNTDAKRKFDVDAVVGTDPVIPGTKKGLSVLRSGAECQALESKFPVWEIEEDVLRANGLIPIPDPTPDAPTGSHHVLEPAMLVTLDEYQSMLIATRTSWSRVDLGG